MYLTSTVSEDLLSAKGMVAFSEGKVIELLRVNVHIETQHESIPGVTVGTLGGPIYELVQLIHKTLKETGKVLVDSGYPDLGSFVLEALKEAARTKAGDANAQIEVILERVCCISFQFLLD
jgi:hypothetical protein